MKKRMILALVLVFALLCLACANDADDGADGDEVVSDGQSLSVAETGGVETDANAESASSADGTSGETSGETSVESSSGAESGTSGTSGTNKDTSGVETGGTESGTSSNGTLSGNTSNASSNANGTSSGSTSNGTESSGTGSGTSSESSTPAEGSENGDGVDTSSGSGNPSQTAHKHKYKTTVVKPTCTEDGYMVYTCSCGDSYKGEVLPATGHFLTESITKEPTETARGTMRNRCSNRGCDYEETREIYSWNELARVVEERILYWVNKYRAEEGAPTLTMSEKLTELNEVRCEQSLQGGEHKGHNSDDEAKAAEATKCGKFNDFTFVDDYTGELITPNWKAPGQEAWIGRSYWDETAIGDTNAESRIDDRAKNIVDAFRASEGHWVYVGGKGTHYKDYVYVGIGIGPKNCFITVCRYNPDEKGYEHITLDENGDMHSEWVKD